MLRTWTQRIKDRYVKSSPQQLSLQDSSFPEYQGSPFPEYQAAEISPAVFRRLILGRGAIMLRNAVDPRLLEKYNRSLEDIFNKYAAVPAEEFERRLQSSDPVEKDFWEQMQLSHIYDRTFKPFAGYSYFDIIRSTGLWDLAARAFPESRITESNVCNSRHVTDNELQKFRDQPIEFHVDSQFFYHHKLSINFWTPLVSCGVHAPSVKVISLGVAETKFYLEYNSKGYDPPEPKDFAWMNRFHCSKMQHAVLEENGLLELVWAPEFKAGDILAFTNFTMHATHQTKEMTRPRTSIEVRIDLPSVSI